MNFLNDVITYVRRIVKTPSNASLSDTLIIDYINRFYIMDMDARIQLFDFKTKYQFQTQPGVDKYNMPLYSLQTSPLPEQADSQSIGMYPVYQGFLGPCYIYGIEIPFQTQKDIFYNYWPNVVQELNVVATGDGGPGPYEIQLPILNNPPAPLNPPVNAILRGHVDISGVIAANAGNIDPPIASNTTMPNLLSSIPVTSIDAKVFFTTIAADGSTVVVSDSGIFLEGNVNYGMLITPGPAPYGNSVLPAPGIGIDAYSTTSNTINYFSGVANITFPVSIPQGAQINCQCLFFQTGLPRSILYYNNCLTLRNPPDRSYLVEIDAYLSPAAFFASSQALPFAYMAEYIARGAARKILSDTGDGDQLIFYEPLFKEQEMLVWKRAQRQFTSTRTQTIYSQGLSQGQIGFNNTGSNVV